MDLLYLREMLSSLSGYEESLRTNAEYCCHQRFMADEVVREIWTQFSAAKKERKHLFIMLLNEILLRSAEQSIQQFIKAVGLRVEQFMVQYAKVAEDPTIVRKLSSVVENWAAKSIFAEKFTSRVKKEVLEPAYRKILHECDNPGGEKQQQKYSSTFLIEYRLLHEQPWTKKAYEASQKWHQIDSQINKFNSEYNNIDWNLKGDGIESRKVQNLLRFAYQYKTQLMELINEQTEVYRGLQTVCQEFLLTQPVLPKKAQ